MGEKILLITSSGGGGLLQAAKAKEQEILVRSPESHILVKDVMLDWSFLFFGRFCVFLWNFAQKRSQLWIQEFFQKVFFAAEILFWLQIFFQVLQTLLRGDFDRIIDTQPLGTSAIIKAIRFVNFWKKKTFHLEKILVDLPTKKSQHFFRGIRKLSSKDRSFLNLITIEPLLDSEATFEEFWHHHCNLCETQVCYEEVLRASFVQYKNMPRGKEPFSILIRTNSSEEGHWQQKLFQKGAIVAKKEEEGFRFFLPWKEWVGILLLGSQPAEKATLTYVTHFLKEVKTMPNKTFHLFVFCGKGLQEKKPSHPLFLRLCQEIEKKESLPRNATIVPISFQRDDVIAPLFFRSNLSLTRSGGQTMVELMAVSQGEKWIHSEAKGSHPSLKNLLRGIPVWEAGNACYLKEKAQGKIVTIATFSDHFRSAFCK